MATILQQKAICVKGAKVEWYPTAAAQTWSEGAFLYKDIYGRLTICTSGATTTIGMAASANAADTVNTSYPVYVPTSVTEFEMNTYHSTPASATTTISLVGNSYNYRAATSPMASYCDRSATTVPFFKVVKLSEKDTAGDLFGRVIVQLVPEVCQVYHSLA